MSHKLKIADVTIGGNGANNPSPLTRDNYDLSSEEQRLTFQNINVIAMGELGVNLYVTGLVVVDLGTGQPKLGPNDPCYLPCPPFCAL